MQKIKDFFVEKFTTFLAGVLVAGGGMTIKHEVELARRGQWMENETKSTEDLIQSQKQNTTHIQSLVGLVRENGHNIERLDREVIRLRDKAR